MRHWGLYVGASSRGTVCQELRSSILADGQLKGEAALLHSVKSAYGEWNVFQHCASTSMIISHSPYPFLHP